MAREKKAHQEGDLILNMHVRKRLAIVSTFLFVSGFPVLKSVHAGLQAGAIKVHGQTPLHDLQNFDTQVRSWRRHCFQRTGG
jgi:hypothetical protein